MAMHPIMDSTSPAHSDWKLWDFGNSLDHGPWPTSIENKKAISNNPALLQETLNRMNNVMIGGSAVDCSCLQ